MFIPDPDSHAPTGEEIFRVTGWSSGEILFAYDHDEIDMIDAVRSIHDASCTILQELRERREKAKEN
jgi:hypothetical protein